jgi:hypothetical protein
MSSSLCANPSCEKQGTLLCTACDPPQARYCSQDCQRSDWPTHKTVCSASRKSKCFIVRAEPRASSDSPASTANYLEHFTLDAYGDERLERAELKRKLGWQSVDDVGKFYDHKGSDSWYYYVYGQYSPGESPQNISAPKNELVSRAVGLTAYGDAVVIRSGPADSNDYSEAFSRTELAKTLDWYKAGKDTRNVYSERERNRIMRHYALSGAGIPHFTSNDTDEILEFIGRQQ